MKLLSKICFTHCKMNNWLLIKLETLLKTWCENIIYTHPYIKNIQINKIYTSIVEKTNNIEVELDITFKPIITIPTKEFMTLKVKENISLSLLKYSKGD